MIAERDLLDRLERVTPRGRDQWQARCPAHEDRDPSLSVKLAADRWLFHCHAGCAPDDVRSALGLDWSELFAERPNGKGEPVATYDYTAEDGELLFQVVRLWPRGFYQQRPDGHGGWIPNLQGTRRVLYRLPRVVEAVKTGATVYVAEGEKDVHALVKAGVCATCNPMGAGKWRDKNGKSYGYSEALAGARVVVVADRDGAGRKHAREVAESLEGVAASVELVEPPEHKDAHEHLTAGRTVAEFEPLGEDEWWRSTLVDMEQAIADAAGELPYVIEPLACRGFLTIVAGRHSSGKSWLSLLLASAVHRGERQLAGFALTQTPAVLVDAENGERLMGRRFRTAGIPADGLHVLDAGELSLAECLDTLPALVKDSGTGLVVFDSLRRLTPQSRENTSDDMAPVVARHSGGHLVRRDDRHDRRHRHSGRTD